MPISERRCRALRKASNSTWTAATPGVDVVFAGTGDLSFSLGLGGEQNHPKLERATENTAAPARRHHKILGPIVSTSDQAQKAIDQGFLSSSKS